jgi:hypothetical protein
LPPDVALVVNPNETFELVVTLPAKSEPRLRLFGDKENVMLGLVVAAEAVGPYSVFENIPCLAPIFTLYVVLGLRLVINEPLAPPQAA